MLFAGFTRAVAVMTLAGLASTQTPLANKRFTYPGGIPYQVDPDNGPRGTQIGYNQCNSTTEGQNSMCQTFFTTSIDDFCLMGPPEPNSLVADTEGEMVAWCTKAGRGTRLIPDGALQGVQFIRAPGYIEVVGYIDQSKINIAANDSGGELDPHGDDSRGNPLGGIMFSQAYNNGQWTQITQWHCFMGGDVFCLKACTPGGQYDNLCDNTHDTMGCEYNVPANYDSINGTFLSCLSDNQAPPGQNAAVPVSSMCTTMTSAALYTDAAKSVMSSASVASVSAASVSSISAASASAAAASRSKATGAPSATSIKSISASTHSAEGFPIVPLLSIVVGAIVGAFAL